MIVECSDFSLTQWKLFKLLLIEIRLRNTYRNVFHLKYGVKYKSFAKTFPVDKKKEKLNGYLQRFIDNDEKYIISKKYILRQLYGLK